MSGALHAVTVSAVKILDMLLSDLLLQSCRKRQRKTIIPRSQERYHDTGLDRLL